MGCDIHVMIEYKEYGEWWSFSTDQISFGRNYPLFSLLAGVRANENIIYPVRGLPNDMSSLCKKVFCEYVSDVDESYKHLTKTFEADWVLYIDYHHFSWLNIDELTNVNDRYSELHLPSISLDVCLAIMKTFESAGKETRIIFAFDN